MTETVTRSELVKELVKEASLTRQDATHIIETLLSEMSSALEQGETVKISSFGTFNVREKVSRIGRNPRTGEEATISARKVITFKASPLFRKEVEEAPVLS